MATNYSPKIVTDGLTFFWDGGNDKSWNGTETDHIDLISSVTGNKIGAGTLERDNNRNCFWTRNGTRTCYLSFDYNLIDVPNGNEGSWIFICNFIKGAENADHPIVSKTTSSGWDGAGGFVIGTGWGTDGLRIGIGGSGVTLSNIRSNNWQIFCVTYKRNETNGLKVFILDSLGYRISNQIDTGDLGIGTSNQNLLIGAANLRGGNWNGGLNMVQIYNRALSESEIRQNFQATRGRYGI
jgi:hypothetical protein